MHIALIDAAKNLGLCRGTLESVLFQLEVLNIHLCSIDDGIRMSSEIEYMLENIEKTVKRTLEEVPSFLIDHSTEA